MSFLPKFPKRLLFRFRPVLRWLMKLRSSPRSIAGGFALGTFIAFTPTLGVQIVIAIFLATLFNCNRPASVVPVWITNPVTMAPIYTFNYFIGQMIWGGPPVSEVSGLFIHVAKIASHLEFWELKESIGAVFSLGTELIIPLSIGSIIVGLTLGTAAYFITLPLVLFVFKRKHQKRILS